MTVQDVTLQLTPEAIALIDMQLFKASVDVGNTYELGDKLETIRMDIEAQIKKQIANGKWD